MITELQTIHGRQTNTQTKTLETNCQTPAKKVDMKTLFILDANASLGGARALKSWLFSQSCSFRIVRFSRLTAQLTSAFEVATAS